MREIPVGSRVALVDDEDFERVSQYTWHLERHASANTERWYARRRWQENGRRRGQFMHQLVSGCSGVDHKDHDGLNNQRSNLRPATTRENQANRRTSRVSAPYRGIFRSGSGWVARISYSGTKEYLGYFGAAEDAARAYDSAAIRVHGEFAILNFPEQEA